MFKRNKRRIWNARQGRQKHLKMQRKHPGHLRSCYRRYEHVLICWLKCPHTSIFSFPITSFATGKLRGFASTCSFLFESCSWPTKHIVTSSFLHCLWWCCKLYMCEMRSAILFMSLSSYTQWYSVSEVCSLILTCSLRFCGLSSYTGLLKFSFIRRLKVCCASLHTVSSFS